MTSKLNTQGAVEIAKDVLKTVKARKYKTSYCYLNGRTNSPLCDIKDLQECVEIVEANCHMCALGGLLLSKAKLYNDVPITSNDDYISFDRSNIVYSLRQYFSDFELAKIESYFEGRVCEFYSNLELDAMMRGAAVAGGSILDVAKRVETAMENVIQNNGVLMVEPCSHSEYYSYLSTVEDEDEDWEDEDEDEDWDDEEDEDEDEDEEDEDDS